VAQVVTQAVDLVQQQQDMAQVVAVLPLTIVKLQNLA
jgi:hypothetical protein